MAEEMQLSKFKQQEVQNFRINNQAYMESLREFARLQENRRKLYNKFYKKCLAEQGNNDRRSKNV